MFKSFNTENFSTIVVDTCQQCNSIGNNKEDIMKYWNKRHHTTVYSLDEGTNFNIDDLECIFNCGNQTYRKYTIEFGANLYVNAGNIIPIKTKQKDLIDLY